MWLISTTYTDIKAYMSKNVCFLTYIFPCLSFPFMFLGNETCYKHVTKSKLFLNNPANSSNTRLDKLFRDNPVDS